MKTIKIKVEDLLNPKIIEKINKQAELLHLQKQLTREGKLKIKEEYRDNFSALNRMGQEGLKIGMQAMDREDDNY